MLSISSETKKFRSYKNPKKQSINSEGKSKEDEKSVYLQLLGRHFLRIKNESVQADLTDPLRQSSKQSQKLWTTNELLCISDEQMHTNYKQNMFFKCKLDLKMQKHRQKMKERFQKSGTIRSISFQKYELDTNHQNDRQPNGREEITLKFLKDKEQNLLDKLWDKYYNLLNISDMKI